MEQSNCSLDPQTLFDVSGRTALITGCSSGLGEAFAIFLAKCGANVVVAGKLE
jgi:NAD(P)-dependent dehydrogenase (short-subunit alcohol dehydrogenase family)